MPPSVIWLNGAFGVGKTATATALAQLRADLRIFDPEDVGFMLRANLVDQPQHDFQDWPAWRQVVAATAQQLIAQTDQSLVAPQTVLAPSYWAQIEGSLESAAISVVHVLLDSERRALAERIRSSDVAVQWRLDHIRPYLDARDAWLLTAADLVIDVTDCSPEHAAEVIAETAFPRPGRD